MTFGEKITRGLSATAALYCALSAFDIALETRIITDPVEGIAPDVRFAGVLLLSVMSVLFAAATVAPKGFFWPR